MGRGVKVKKLFLTLILAIVGIFGCTAAASALTIDAEACILIDAASGRIIYQSNAHEALPPASTTKVLTALLTLKTVDDLSTTVTLPDDFVNVGESGINLQAGDSYTIEDMLYALMLRSANDAGQALAIAVSGSEEAFGKYMNYYTRELGLTDSVWSNAHGLDDDDHLASAYDLAMITREAVRYPKFNEIITTESWTLPWLDNDYDRVIYNHNQFLTTYEGADGVKTGYTEKAGNCLIASATRECMRLIGVVLNCPNQSHYTQMTALMDYGFANYKPLKLASAGDVVGSVRISKGAAGKVDAVLMDDIIIAVPNNSTYEPKAKIDLPSSLEAPQTTDQPVGTVTYTDDMGNEIKGDIYLKEAVAKFTFADALRAAWQSFVNALF